MIYAISFGIFNVIVRLLLLALVMFTFIEIKNMNSKLINYKELYEKTSVQIGCSFRPG